MNDLTLIENDKPAVPFRPFCMACGWRKGGPDSWNGSACKCGHSEPPIKLVQEPPKDPAK